MSESRSLMSHSNMTHVTYIAYAKRVTSHTLNESCHIYFIWGTGYITYNCIYDYEIRAMIHFTASHVTLYISYVIRITSHTLPMPNESCRKRQTSHVTYISLVIRIMSHIRAFVIPAMSHRVMSHCDMGHVSFAWVMSNCYITHCNVGHVTYEWVMSHCTIGHVTYAWILSHCDRGHITYEWVICHTVT